MTEKSIINQDELWPYYTLVEFVDGAYHPQFGDFERRTVAAEMEELIAKAGRGARKRYRIVRTDDARQVTIDAAIKEMNDRLADEGSWSPKGLQP